MPYVGGDKFYLIVLENRIYVCASISGADKEYRLDGSKNGYIDNYLLKSNKIFICIEVLF